MDKLMAIVIHLAHRHLSKIQAKDLVVADRYYGSKPLFMLLVNQGAEFCFRLKVHCWNVVKQLAESTGEKERFVKFQITDKKARANNLSFSELTCRLIRIELDSGEIGILCTSLTDVVKYPIEQFKALYHQRWMIEESYKLFKHRLEIENFSGKTTLAILQDFYVKIFLNNLQSALVSGETQDGNEKNVSRKHQHKINRSYMVSAF